MGLTVEILGTCLGMLVGLLNMEQIQSQEGGRGDGGGEGRNSLVKF